MEHSFSAHTRLGKIALILFYRGNQGSERLSNLPNVTPLESYRQELILSDALTKGP